MSKELFDQLNRTKYFVDGYEVSIETKLKEQRQQEQHHYNNLPKKSEDERR